MDRLPDAVFVTDLKTEEIAVHEAARLRIPIIGLVDTNCDPTPVDYVIPGNDDAIRSCQLIIGTIGSAVEEGAGAWRVQEEKRIAEEMERRKREEEERRKREEEEKVRLEAEQAKKGRGQKRPSRPPPKPRPKNSRKPVPPRAGAQSAAAGGSCRGGRHLVLAGCGRGTPTPPAPETPAAKAAEAPAAAEKKAEAPAAALKTRRLPPLRRKRRRLRRPRLCKRSLRKKRCSRI